MAAEKTYNDLNVSLKKANEHRNAWFEGVQKCSLDETLYTVMERIVRAEVHRLVVVDENDKVIGIISLSDLLLYLVLRPSGDGLGDSESLRASDPALIKSKSESSSINQKSIEEETQRELDQDAEEAEEALNIENEKTDSPNQDKIVDSDNEARENDKKMVQSEITEENTENPKDDMINTSIQIEMGLVSE